MIGNPGFNAWMAVSWMVSFCVYALCIAMYPAEEACHKVSILCELLLHYEKFENMFMGHAS